MVKILLMAAGGAAGTVLRYAVTVCMSRVAPAFPLGVLTVNAAGSFLIGLCWCLAEAFHWSFYARAFLFTGLFGGFTTFSSFSLDTMELFRVGAYKAAGLNIVANNALGLMAVFAGFFVGRQILR
ncbi:crcB-like family protein [Bacteroidales bacterium Barb4]|nr:crcB-like family protein [Bacteroidales bacterium Barb4]